MLWRHVCAGPDGRARGGCSGAAVVPGARVCDDGRASVCVCGRGRGRAYAVACAWMRVGRCADAHVRPWAYARIRPLGGGTLTRRMAVAARERRVRRIRRVSPCLQVSPEDVCSLWEALALFPDAPCGVWSNSVIFWGVCDGTRASGQGEKNYRVAVSGGVQSSGAYDRGRFVISSRGRLKARGARRRQRPKQGVPSTGPASARANDCIRVARCLRLSPRPAARVRHCARPC